MAASHTRVRVAPNLYQRGDGRYVAGLSIEGRWTMETLRARTKTAAKLELGRWRTELDEAGLAERPPVYLKALNRSKAMEGVLDLRSAAAARVDAQRPRPRTGSTH
jgi:hypothetical protein